MSAGLGDLDATHDPSLRSWVVSANTDDTDFPIQNLPFGRVLDAAAAGDAAGRVGVAIGDQVLDLAQAGLIDAAQAHDLTSLMQREPAARRALRHTLSQGLAAGSAHEAAWRQALRPMSALAPALPCTIGDYTDFYIGIHHARTIGRLFRPDSPLLPNYMWVPIGYHGRSSTIRPSGHNVVRPRGQVKGPNDEVPRLAPTQRLDYELELGIFIGRGNLQGEPIPIDDAESHVFGLALFNDWSARDIQSWEYQPLGPFLSKNFASTLSPWIVTLEALAPFRRPFVRPEGDPPPLPYLDSAANRAAGAFDIQLEVWLQTAAMRAAGRRGERLARSNFADAAYWTVAQLVAHHTVNGCALASGDLFGSGTLSGPTPEQAGSLIEMTAGGKQPIGLGDGEQRTFLLDGDEVSFGGRCERAGLRSIGFGRCSARVLPAR